MIHSQLCPSIFILLLILMIVMALTSIVTPAPVVSDGKVVMDSISGSRHKRDTFDIIGMLSTYGYLPRHDNDGIKGQLMSREMFTEAIRKYQKFNGLEVTGEVDAETVRKMRSPRCGFPDILDRGGHETDDEGGPQAYSSLGGRWRENTVYWKANRLTEKLDSRQQMSAFQSALGIWEEVTPLQFNYSSSHPDIEIFFARGVHGDGWRNRFDGKSGVLAHAYSPGRGLGGDVHFDDDEDWTVHTGVGSDLLQVAAHEIGHALGLGHSSNPGALMAPVYAYTENLSLHEDDINGIQSLYGRPNTTESTDETPATTSTAATSSTPQTTTPPPSTTTTTTTTTTASMPWIPEFCRANFRLDAISEGPDGFIYAFRERFVYKIGETGLELQFPKLITDVFPGAPRRNVRAVTHVPTTGKTYMFKDARVWRFTGFDLDSDYPKIYSTSSYFKPSAAMTLNEDRRSRVFMFGYNYFWEWDPRTESLVPGYPLSSRAFFSSIPILPDAAYRNGQGNLFFFKYNKFRMAPYRGATPQSYRLGPNLFGPICGFNPEDPVLVTLKPSISFPTSFLNPSAIKCKNKDVAPGKQQTDLNRSPMISSLFVNGKERVLD